MTIRELMTGGLITVRPEIPVQQARDLMAKERIRHLPVVGPGGGFRVAPFFPSVGEGSRVVPSRSPRERVGVRVAVGYRLRAARVASSWPWRAKSMVSPRIRAIS